MCLHVPPFSYCTSTYWWDFFVILNNCAWVLVLAKLLQFLVQPLGVRLDGKLSHGESGNPVAVIHVLCQVKFLFFMDGTQETSFSNSVVITLCCSDKKKKIKICLNTFQVITTFSIS